MVFHLDFSSFEGAKSETALRKAFIKEFDNIAELHFNTKLSSPRSDSDEEGSIMCSYFEALITLAKEKKKEPTKRLGLLIDEYDTPITDHLRNMTRAKDMQRS